MNYIELFKEEEIPISWTSLLIGFKGPGKFEGLLNCNEIINFAINIIETRDNYTNYELELASAYEYEEDLISKLLIELSEKEEVNEEKELTKWIVILLKEQLKDMPEKPLYGLLRLTEFWEKFNYPNFSPHVVQGREEEIEPYEYYSYSNYIKSVKKHEDWIKHTKKNF